MNIESALIIIKIILHSVISRLSSTLTFSLSIRQVHAPDQNCQVEARSLKYSEDSALQSIENEPEGYSNAM
jgi:hypothetical protein